MFLMQKPTRKGDIQLHTDSQHNSTLKEARFNFTLTHYEWYDRFASQPVLQLNVGCLISGEYFSRAFRA